PFRTCGSVTLSISCTCFISQELSVWGTQAFLSCSLSSGWGVVWQGPLGRGISDPHAPGVWCYKPLRLHLPYACRLLRGDAVVELGLKDYLDIFCPHYESPGPPEGPETFALYMVDRPGYEACRAEGPGAFKRWECSLPFAPFGPVRFSEKIQRFTPFSLGFEFLPGETYYYISVPTPESPGQCLRLQVSVCCKEDKPESAHPVGSPGESGTSGWQGGATPSPLCLLLLLLLPILRLLRVL
uniref:Ephrin-A4 n=1 Tax=Camelus bactrianus TaxID=9837 RepID=A0A9W3G3T6_CAMBA